MKRSKTIREYQMLDVLLHGFPAWQIKGPGVRIHFREGLDASAGKACAEGAYAAGYRAGLRAGQAKGEQQAKEEQ